MTKRLLFLLPLLAAACGADEIRVPGCEPWDSPFAYRSISFGTPGGVEGIQLDLNRDMVRLAAGLGFNDVTIQTEHRTMPKLRALRKWADETGNFEFIRDLGMTLSVWVHELNDLPGDIGEPTLDNERLWNELRRRYRHVCTELLPEVDYYILTVVESQLWVSGDPEVLAKLVTVINDECRKAGKKLVFRTLVWHLGEAEVIKQALLKLPPEVIVMSKCVPVDWHLRGVDNPFIGGAGARDQFVEFDIAGEYNKLTHTACAFTDVLKRQLDHAARQHCDGINVRVDRYGSTPWGEAQEANLWFLGLHASGRCVDEMKIWRRYATELFGPKAAPAMVEALYPTGDVVAEALCVEREPFGTSRSAAPGSRKMANPFDQLHAPAKWDQSLRPLYHKILAGDPGIIRRKQEAFDTHLAGANRSLELVDSVKDDLPPGAYPFFRWKLEENRTMLEMYCNMELAWLKDQRLRRTRDPREQQTLESQVQAHLAALRQLDEAQAGQTLEVTWRGATHSLRRGSFEYRNSPVKCLDVPAWLKVFEDYRRRASAERLADAGIARDKPVSCSSQQTDYPARQANDGDPNTYWQFAGRQGGWWQVDLGRPNDLERVRILWEREDLAYQYKIDGSADGATWKLLVDKTANRETSRQADHATDARGIRYLRITLVGLQGGYKGWHLGGLAEVRVFGRPSGRAGQARPALVFLIAGQSNAAGIASFSPELNFANNPELAKQCPTQPGSTAGEIGLPFTAAAYPRSFIWSADKKSFQPFAPGTPLMQAGMKGDWNRHGIELPMAWRLEKLFPEHDKYFIKYARGGTNLYDQWNPARKDGLFRQFVNCCRGGMAELDKRYPEVRVLALYWDQGESDEPRARDYEANLAGLVAAMRRETGLPELKVFLRKHLFMHRNAAFQPIIDGQARLAARDDKVWLLDLDLGSDEANFKAWSWMPRNGHLSSKAFLELTDRLLAILEPTAQPR